MKKISLKIWVVGTFFLSALPVAWSTSFNIRPFPEYVSDAPIIVRGAAGRSYSNWGGANDKSRRIFTYTEIQVAETLKGQVSGRSIIVRELGGEKDGIGMHVSGTAKFHPGEDVVVFVREPSPEDGSYPLAGMMLGKLMVDVDAAGEETLRGGALANPLSQMVERYGGAGKTGGRKAPGAKWTLADLRELIQSQKAQEGPTGKGEDTKTHTAITPAESPTQSGNAQLPQPNSSGSDSATGVKDERISNWFGVVKWIRWLLFIGLGVGFVVLIRALLKRSSD